MADKTTAKVVDFSNVKDSTGSFNKRRVPSGDYLAKIVKVEDAESKGDKTFQYLFTIKLQKYSTYAYPYYCKLQENQLWKLRNLFIAAGINVPKKRIKVDPTKVLNKVIGVTMEDDEYEGKLQSVVAAVFPASELSADDMSSDVDDDEEPEEEEDEDIDLGDEDEDEADDEAEDEDEADEFESMDRNELKAHLKSFDPSFQARKSQTDDDLRALARAKAVEAGSDDDEEDEPEPEPEPAPKVKKKATKPKKKAADVTDEELEELDIDDL